jgi:HAD superfamily hydrolase (TIGR01509 family)
MTRWGAWLAGAIEAGGRTQPPTTLELVSTIRGTTMPIEALIFDFDGLIVDTETPAFESWRTIYREYGVELPLEVWQHAIGTNSFDTYAYLEQLVGRPLDRATVMELRMRHKRELSADQPLLQGVEQVLADARGLGLKLAVASSSDRAWVVGWLERHAIRQHFACVLTADDVERVKPDPALFLTAAACLGVAPAACVVFEDSANGILAAKAAGMRVVAVPGPITRQLVLPPADLTIGSLDELPLQELLARLEQPGVPAP